VVQLWWLLLFLAGLATQLPGCIHTLTKIFFLVDIRISSHHLLLLVATLAVQVHWDGLYRVPDG